MSNSLNCRKRIWTEEHENEHKNWPRYFKKEKKTTKYAMQINHNNSCALNNIYIFYGFYDIDSYGVLCDDGICLRQQPESEKKCHGEKTIKNLIFYHNNNNNIRRVFGEGPSYD